MLNPYDLQQTVKQTDSELVNSGVSMHVAASLKQEARLNMHACAQVDGDFNAGVVGLGIQNVAERELLARMRQLLKDDVYARFTARYSHPLPSNAVVSKIALQLTKAINGHGGKTVVTNPTADFNAISEQWGMLNKGNNFAEQCLSRYYDCIHSLVMIDAPEDGGDPYFYFLPTERIRNVKPTIEGDKLEWVIFDDGENDKVRYLWNETEYQRWVRDENSGEYELDKPISHGLGFCPARPIWTVLKDRKSNLWEKRGLLTDYLTRLDFFVLFEYGIEVQELYNLWPTLMRYEAEGEGDEPNEGVPDYLQQGQEVISGGEHTAAATKSNTAAFPSEMTSQMPMHKDDADNLQMAMYLTPDSGIVSLSFDREVAKERYIIDGVLGGAVEQQNTQAMNEDQVQSAWEGRRQVLVGIAEQIEAAATFAYTTIARLMGANQTTVTVHLGKTFYLRKPEDIADELKALNESGAPETAKEGKLQELLASTFAEDEQERVRAMWLQQIEPFPTMSLNEVMANSDKLPQGEVLLKAQWLTAVKWWERTNGPLMANLTNLQEDSITQAIEQMRTDMLEYVQPKEEMQGDDIEEEEITDGNIETDD